jgi:hypothetical protein
LRMVTLFQNCLPHCKHLIQENSCSCHPFVSILSSLTTSGMIQLKLGSSSTSVDTWMFCVSFYFVFTTPTSGG